MAHHRIEYDEACKSCKSTGVYVGMAERDGAAVVCQTCRGTGRHHVILEYDDFDGRQWRPLVQRVYEVNPGICIGRGKDHEYSLEDFGGMPYDAWRRNEPFPAKSENRRFTCPAWWYQSADYDRKPKWRECIGIGSFSNCPHFPRKNQCWARWDGEQKPEKGNG